jgi:hypothetical protein
MDAENLAQGRGSMKKRQCCSAADADWRMGNMPELFRVCALSCRVGYSGLGIKSNFILLPSYLFTKCDYIGNLIRNKMEVQMANKKKASKKQGPERVLEVERVQLGVRLEKRMVKVLKAVAEYFDVTLTDLLESIVLHSFEGGGANAFMDDVIPKINEFKKIYGMDYGVHDNYRFSEKELQA